MIECAGGLCLLLETSETFRVLRERRGQNLDRDFAIELRIARAIHLAHPAFAEFIRHLIV